MMKDRAKRPPAAKEIRHIEHLCATAASFFSVDKQTRRTMSTLLMAYRAACTESGAKEAASITDAIQAARISKFVGDFALETQV